MGCPTHSILYASLKGDMTFILNMHQVTPSPLTSLAISEVGVYVLIKRDNIIIFLSRQKGQAEKTNSPLSLFYFLLFHFLGIFVATI